MSLPNNQVSPYGRLDDRSAVLALWYIVNASLVSYYKLIQAFGDSSSALLSQQEQWQALGIHKSHMGRWLNVSDVLAFLDKVKQETSQGAYGLLFALDESYPACLMQIYDPPPVLFYRGNLDRLKDKQIAIVGSREPTDHAKKTTFDLAQYLVQAGYTITSGLAQGVDYQAHQGALAQMPALMGRTVGVLGTGIDVCYPRNHHALFAQIVADGGCLLSELLPSTPASKHTFPRRNRLVAGLSLATVVTEATLQSGSLITARLSAEQGKQVFALPSLVDNKQAEGCHHLIREGATLIYHPEQILEDLGNQEGISCNALPKSFSQGLSIFSDADTDAQEPKVANPKQVAKVIPEHLMSLYDLLQDPCDLDYLVWVSQQKAGDLLACLMELELLGLVYQAGGRYVRQ